MIKESELPEGFQPNRIVEVVDETPEGTMVKIRNFFEPIFVGLFKIALPKMEMYQSDLGHDAIWLSNAKTGDKYLWGWRPSGTTMVKLERIGNDNTMTAKAWAASCANACPLDNWYLIEVTGVRHGHADGYITWIRAKDVDHLTRVIDENLDKPAVKLAC